MKTLGALPEDDTPEACSLLQEAAKFLKRDLFRIPPRETPARIWPQTPAPAPVATSSTPVEAARPAPVATGALPSGTTVVREIKIEQS